MYKKKKFGKNRNLAKRKQEQQATKMIEKSNKRFKPADYGENVNVPIPDVDRGKLDPPNFTAVVMKHNMETGLYSLGTRVGTLEQQFSRNQFELLTE